MIGGAVGATAGAIQDATQGNNGRVLTKGLGGAGMGFFGSCAALAGVGVVATVRHDKFVYEDRRKNADREQSPLAANRQRKGAL